MLRVAFEILRLGIYTGMFYTLTHLLDVPFGLAVAFLYLSVRIDDMQRGLLRQ